MSAAGRQVGAAMSDWIKSDEDPACVVLPAVRHADEVARIVRERVGLTAKRYRKGRMAKLVWCCIIRGGRYEMAHIFTATDAEIKTPPTDADLVIMRYQESVRRIEAT